MDHTSAVLGYSASVLASIYACKSTCVTSQLLREAALYGRVIYVHFSSPFFGKPSEGQDDLGALPWVFSRDRLAGTCMVVKRLKKGNKNCHYMTFGQLSTGEEAFQLTDHCRPH